MKIEDLKYSKAIRELLDEIDRQRSIDAVLELADQCEVEVEYVPVDSGLYRIVDMRIRSGYFSPSYFSSYFSCARRLWLRKRHGDLVDAEGLKRILRGRIAQKLWIQSHPDFTEEYEVADNELKVHGFIDAVKMLDGKAVLVELKTAHRVSLGHRLQTMLYKMVLEKNLEVKADAFLVYRHGVKRVDLNLGLLERYTRRVKAVLESDFPPPKLPGEKYCPRCPYRFYCDMYPVTDWDEWLVSIGDLPKGEKCKGCDFLYSCRGYRGRCGRYPCEVNQEILVKIES